MNIITTEKRGVFFGEIVERAEDKLVLADAQMCVYWSTNVKGVLGLASTGPTETCRITNPIPRIELFGITAIMDVTPEAEAAWKKCFWG